jgi:hypothetical protein
MIGGLESTHRCWYYSFSYNRNNSVVNFKRTGIFASGYGMRKMLCLLTKPVHFLGIYIM